MDLDLSGHVQFGGVQLHQDIQSTEDQDGNDDGKITDERTELEHIQGEQRRTGERRFEVGALDNEEEGTKLAAVGVFSNDSS